MKLRHALIASATALALVAAPAIAAGPAQAAPEKASGTTLISFKKEYAGIFKLVKPVKPAKFIDSRLTFPVTGTEGDLVFHSGGIQISKTKFMKPTLKVNAAKKRATITVEFEDGRIPLFYVKHFKVKADGVDGQVWQGNLHLTKNKTVVDTLNEIMGVDSLTPGLGLGQLRTTIRK
jgi:hypothetical protein